jgi:uncharacterized protein
MPSRSAQPGQTIPGSQTSRVKSRKPPKVRHVPQRTCISCRQVRPKRELIRVVRTSLGHVELDATGKKSGRGAYLCAKRSCWEPALSRGKLEHEFEITLLPDDRAALLAYGETLPPEDRTASPKSGGARSGDHSRQRVPKPPPSHP